MAVKPTSAQVVSIGIRGNASRIRQAGRVVSASGVLDSKEAVMSISQYPARSPSIGRKPTCQDCQHIRLETYRAGCAEGLWIIRGTPGVSISEFLTAIKMAKFCHWFAPIPEWEQAKLPLDNPPHSVV
jgi:hypothetical protein